MKPRIAVLMMVVAAVALLVTDDLSAQTESTRARHGGARRAIAEHTTAVATLDGVGAVEGWGHVMVKDVLLKDGTTRREMSIHLLGLVSSVDYSLTIDGYPAAELTTDDNGDARLRLSSWRDTEPPFPEALPQAIELMLATVYDADGAVTLEGKFVARTVGHQGPRDLVYAERIRLEPLDDANLRGMARVSRDGDDQQRFETRAAGLLEDSYEVVVDGSTVGVVTVDGAHHAVLVLSTADDDVLPAVLDPIEEAREVAWVNSAGTTVLFGSFIGENMVGEGPLRDRMGDGDGQHGPGDRPTRPGGPQGPGGSDGSGSGGGPHGDGECDGSGNDGGQGNGGGN
jgi:hypothetical protein